jgi:glycine/D-amino acid oxidase-like deaminating enzyme
VQPLAYVRGLAHALLRQGGQLYTHSPALKLARVGPGYRIETPGGSLSASLVIVATNAYTGSLTETLRRSVVAVPSFQVATAPLADALRAGILPEGQAASDTCRLLRYFRLDSSGRLVMGTRGSYTATPTPFTARCITIAPSARSSASRESASTTTGRVRRHDAGSPAAPARFAPGMYVCLGYNGCAVAMATVMLLARWALGESPTELGFPVTPVRPIRLHALSRVGVRATIQYLRLADAWTRSQG